MGQPAPARGPLWVYSYELVPPQPRERLRALLRVLEQERAHAQLRAGTWQAKLVVEQHATHVFIVSDRPDLELEANRHLEEELRRLNVDFAVTTPLATLADDAGRDSTHD